MSLTKLDVAITTFRRPEMIVAAIRSCLDQGAFLDRVVVVDDASGDDTPARIAGLGDGRILLHVRSRNGGIGAARRDALERCSADWTVLLDSDQELLPGALGALARLAGSVDSRVGILGARFRWDTGAVTPRRIPAEQIGYEGRIWWSAQRDGIGHDYLCCISRRVRERVKWSPERGGLVDALFQLDAARVADARFTGECLGYEKSDGAEGHSRGSAEHLLARRRKDAPGGVALCREILERHGPALRARGKPLLVRILKQGAFAAALTGRRFLAAGWALRALALGGPALVTPGLVPACLAGPTLFSWAYSRALVRGAAPPPAREPGKAAAGRGPR